MKKDDYKIAQEWAIKNLLDKKVYHKEIKDYILFNNKGLSHSIYAKKYSEKAALIYDIEDLIRKSKLYSIENDKKNRPDIKKIYRLISDWSFKKKNYFIYIVVRETNSGKYFYDHGIIKEKP